MLRQKINLIILKISNHDKYNMDIIEIITTIKEDWVLLVFFFTMGGAWWQGKAWFKKLDDTLLKSNGQHGELSKVLEEVHSKLDTINSRITSLETTTTRMHDDLHEAEVKLAVLQNTQDITEGKTVRRITRRKTA